MGRRKKEMALDDDMAGGISGLVAGFLPALALAVAILACFGAFSEGAPAGSHVSIAGEGADASQKTGTARAYLEDGALEVWMYVGGKKGEDFSYSVLAHGDEEKVSYELAEGAGTCQVEQTATVPENVMSGFRDGEYSVELDVTFAGGGTAAADCGTLAASGGKLAMAGGEADILNGE